MRILRSRTALSTAIAALLVVAFLPATAGSANPAQVTVNVDRAKTDVVSQMSVGTTLTGYTLSKNGNAAAIKSGASLLRQAGHYQVQMIFGNGASNPEPAPGVYNWTNLDARVAQITATGGVPVLDMFGAPDWMKGGLPYQTDWTKISVAPLPAHYGDFAALGRQVALRYPSVRNYIVWNENQGFWNKPLGNYDYVAYTNMYNQMYDALKSVNPLNRVGGPYLVLDGTGSQVNSSIYTAPPIIARDLTYLNYWLSHKHGADFLVMDRKLAQRADTYAYTNDQLMALTPWFELATQKLRALTPLPIWFSESYFRCQSGNENFMAAGLASMLYHEMHGGAAASMRWSPERQPGMVGCPYLADNLQNLFTSTLVAGGGQPLPAYSVYQAFNSTFAAGAQLYQTTSSSPMVEALATATKTMLINKMSTAVNVNLNGKIIYLSPYRVIVV